MVKKIASLIMIVTFVMGFSVSAFAHGNSIDFSKIQTKKPALHEKKVVSCIIGHADGSSFSGRCVRC